MARVRRAVAEVRNAVVAGLVVMATASIVAAQATTTTTAPPPNTTTTSGTTTTTSTSSTTTTAPSPPVLPSIDTVRVTAVTAKGGGAEAGIDDIIVVKVTDLKNLVDLAKCVATDGKRVVTGCTERQIALYLDGREIKGLQPESGAPLPDRDTLQFHLQRSADSDEAWADLLGGPSASNLFVRPTPITVGLSGEYGLASDVTTFPLVRVHRPWFIGSSILLLVLLILLFVLATRSELLRDTGPIPAPQGGRKRHKPYSLARFQMAFWFVLVVVSFTFIWLATNAMDTITGSTLGLIGIGAGTFLGARAIDAGAANLHTTKVSELTLERATLQADVTTLAAQLATAAPADAVTLQQQVNAKTARLAQVDTDLANAAAALAPKVSDGFINDVLTDPHDGISFHRFQIFVWTLVLGVLFVYSVWKRLSMPAFDGTQLGLLGISAGTYLGFKIPEKQA
jgi:hypothetical protein